MKVAIYARYSSENQRDASMADQFRVCREFAQRQGRHIEREYSDHAMSGATLRGRSCAVDQRPVFSCPPRLMRA